MGEAGGSAHSVSHFFRVKEGAQGQKLANKKSPRGVAPVKNIEGEVKKKRGSISDGKCRVIYVTRK